jgi:FkbM family methyltransferase
MRLAGTGPLSWPLRDITGAVFAIRDRCAISAEIRFGDRNLRFRCRSRRALRRAATLFVKEQGTVQWLSANIRPGDIVLDIGANVGMYSILAAALAGPTGHVFAVEPHIVNAAALLENVAANGFGDRVSVLTVALGPRIEFESFNYRDWEIGSAFSQLGGVMGEGGQEFQPVAREWKPSITVDGLVAKNAIRSPSIVKLDVDGLEAGVLAGMTGVLRSASRPRSVQVEISPRARAEIESLMASHGYRVEARHHTTAGKKHIRGGRSELELDHNAVFVPADGV